jgi:two-component system cell cycle sensor histidine kinase/response regulator CckA
MRDSQFTAILKARYVVAGLVLVAGLLLTLFVHSEYKNHKIKRQNDDQRLIVDFNQYSIQKEIQSNFASVELLARHFQDQPSFTRTGFRHYSTPLLWGFSNIKAISWVPLVRFEDREAFVREQQKEFGSRFFISELNDARERVKAGEREFYFPVTYIEPLDQNLAALGYDISSSEIRNLALERALKQGGLAITSRITLVQDPEGFGFLGVVPVFKEGGSGPGEHARTDLLGYVSAVYKSAGLLETALEMEKETPLNLVALDVTDGGSVVIYGNESRQEDNTLVGERTIPVADRVWKLQFYANPANLKVKDSWVILLSGSVTSFFIFMLLMAPYLKEQRNRIILEKLQKSRIETKVKGESLIESENYNRLLFDETPIGLALTTLEGTMVDVNPAYSRIIGRTVEETLGLTYWDITPDKYAEQEKKQLRELETLGKYGPYEKEYIHSDGSLIPVRLNGRLIKRKGTTYIWSTVEDISGRKQAELKMREQEEQFRTTFEYSATGMCITSMKGELLQVNARLCEMLEYPAEDLVGRHFNTITLPEDAEIGNDIVQKMISGDIQNATFEKRYLTSSGNIIWVHISSALLRDSAGDPLYFITQMEDITENIVADNMLKTSETRYKALVEQSLAGIYIFEKEKFQYVNRRFCEIFGYTEEEVLRDLKPTDVVFEEDRPKAADNINRRMSGEVESVHYQARGNHKDGRALWIEIHGTHIHLEGKDLITGVVLDITERRVAEEARKKTAEQYRALFEYAPDGILIADQESYYLDANSSMCRMLGYTWEELVGLHASDIVDQSLVVNIKPALNAIISNDDYHSEWIFRRKDGSSFTAEVIATQMPDGNLMAMVRDITDRKRSQALLEKSEERLRKAQSIAGLGNWELDLETGKTWASAQAFRILGFEQESDYLSLDDVKFRPGDSRKVHQALDDLINGKVDFDLEYEVLVGDENDVTVVRSFAELVCDEEGNPLQVLGIVMDVTEDKIQEQENNKLTEQLQRAQKMESVGRLAGGVAHDFNNMLGVILGRCEMVLDKLGKNSEAIDPSVQADLQEILEAGQRSASLTRQLLAFASKQTIAPTALDLNATVESMLKMLRRLIGEDIDLAWLPGKNLWLVKMDPSQVDQILANLCVNARDAIGDTGKLTIETSNASFDEAYCVDHEGYQPGEYVKLAVSDNGCGMDAETQRSLFEPFYTTKELGKGTGLGLATVYGIIRQNGGFIGVYSELGQGTTFKIYLPRNLDEVDVDRPLEPQDQNISGKEVILLVEDEEAILELATIMLQRFGYTVLAANSPGEAIALARDYAHDIHLLITDVVMPEMNGRDLVGNLAPFHPGLRCLFMSGYTANVIAHHGVLDPDVHFLQKPFSKQELGKSVRKVLDRES